MISTLMVLRKKAGLTQLALATEVGVTQSEISVLESGYRIRRMDVIAKYFNVETPDDLLLDWDQYREKQAAVA